jgi:hypothetical protein
VPISIPTTLLDGEENNEERENAIEKNVWY